MRHIEFFHTDHFENNYHRVPPPSALSRLIDFFWETKFEKLWSTYPNGFSDAQFPNTGYTYIINLGTPFFIQVEEERLRMKTDGFLPRYHAIESFHKPGDQLFGIKFRISPVIFEKKVDFSEYKGYIFPLSYLLDARVIEKTKKASGFGERVDVLSKYFLSLISKYEGSMQPIHIVSEILDRCFQSNQFQPSLEKLAHRYRISSRTLQRYFETCTGISAKQALQVMRIRKAVGDLINDPLNFDHRNYGYYDHSHFYKHLREFLSRNSFGARDLHLDLLKKLI